MSLTSDEMKERWKSWKNENPEWLKRRNKKISQFRTIKFNKNEKEDIIKRYISLLQTCKQIAKGYNISPQTIWRRLKKWGIKLKSPHRIRILFSNEELQKVKRMYLGGDGLYSIAKHFNRGIGTIEKQLKKMDIKISTRFEGRKKQSKKALKLWQNLEYKEKRLQALFKSRKINKLEQSLDNLLQTHFPNEWKYVGNGQIFIARKVPDFLNINGKKKLIELFGNYWHKKEDEFKRKNHFAKYGFKTLIIWEDELKQQPKMVIEKIRGF